MVQKFWTPMPLGAKQSPQRKKIDFCQEIMKWWRQTKLEIIGFFCRLFRFSCFKIPCVKINKINTLGTVLIEGNTLVDWIWSLGYQLETSKKKKNPSFLYIILRGFLPRRNHSCAPPIWCFWLRSVPGVVSISINRLLNILVCVIELQTINQSNSILKLVLWNNHSYSSLPS